MSIEEEIQQTKPLRSVGEAFILNVIKTADILKGSMDAVLKPFGLTQAQFNILRILKGAEGEGRTCGEISERMVTKVPDVTRLVDRMVKKELARRERCTEDRRVVWIFITEKGLEQVNEVSPLIEAVTDQTTGELPENRVLEAISVLENFRKNINNKS
jgi:DNA-binding MarR family transcriptional regulator